MTVRMMHVWEMWMAVSQGLMLMKMAVRLTRWFSSIVIMQMMLIVHMRVGVCHSLMGVLVFVMFS